MGLAEVIAHCLCPLDRCDQLRRTVLQSSCAYSAQACTEASAYTSGACCALLCSMDSIAMSSLVQFRAIGINGYVARRADKEDAGEPHLAPCTREARVNRRRCTVGRKRSIPRLHEDVRSADRRLQGGNELVRHISQLGRYPIQRKGARSSACCYTRLLTFIFSSMLHWPASRGPLPHHRNAWAPQIP